MIKLDMTPQRSRSAKAKQALGQKGWTKQSPTHSQNGHPKMPIVHKEWLDLLNYAIEKVYLERHIFPGARLCHPRLGPGTVITCKLTPAYMFSFLPDSELDVEENGVLQLKWYNPEELHPNWQFPERIGLEKWLPLKADEDEEHLLMTGDQRKELANMSSAATPWQLGEMIRFLVGQLRDKVKLEGG